MPKSAASPISAACSTKSASTPPANSPPTTNPSSPGRRHRHPSHRHRLRHLEPLHVQTRLARRISRLPPKTHRRIRPRVRRPPIETFFDLFAASTSPVSVSRAPVLHNPPNLRRTPVCGVGPVSSARGVSFAFPGARRRGAKSRVWSDGSFHQRARWFLVIRDRLRACSTR